MSPQFRQAIENLLLQSTRKLLDDPEFLEGLRQVIISALPADASQLSSPLKAELPENAKAASAVAETVVAPPVAPAVTAPIVPIVAAKPPANVIPVDEAINRLTLGKGTPHSTVVAAATSSPTQDIHDDELLNIEKRCQLKAEATRWRIERAKLLAGGVDKETFIIPRDREIIARAKQLPECFLWMHQHEVSLDYEAELYEDVAGSFEALAHAVATVRELLEAADEFPDEFEESLRLLAEAQSAVRSATSDLEVQVESDQIKTYRWLRETLGVRRIYVDRYMKVNDRADYSRWEELNQRIGELDGRWNELRSSQKQRKRLIGNLRYVCGEIRKSTDDNAHLWDKVVVTIEELLRLGERASNREIREHLLPIFGEIPEDLEISPEVQSVLDEIDRYIASRPELDDTASAAVVTPEVAEVNKLLQGTSMVLVGGERRRPAEDALRRAFGLKELKWAAARDHESLSRFEPAIADPDVSVVLLAIRWSSHSYGGVKDYCDQYGKLLVRLPGGYHQNRVAAEILQQVGDRLRAGVGVGT